MKSRLYFSFRDLAANLVQQHTRCLCLHFVLDYSRDGLAFGECCIFCCLILALYEIDGQFLTDDVGLLAHDF